jgi:hypothetical protein
MYVPGSRFNENRPGMPSTTFSDSPRMMPDLFLSSISDTFEVPPLVTANVTGPAGTWIDAGVQPASTSVTATLCEPLAAVELEPHAAIETAATAQTASAAAREDTFMFN